MKKTAAVDAKGLTLSVYRNAEYATDFTLGGLTGRHNAVTLIGFQTPDDEDEDRAFYPLLRLFLTYPMTIYGTGLQWVIGAYLLALAALMSASVVSGGISEIAPTSVVLPTANGPVIKTFTGRTPPFR